ncbi:dipeptide ABC transporter ATP-binding protein [Actinomadura harenae]|uniref:ABC transporter ATP-binding protein n=1 Tax=Actinomadura harenae TaxID=2483351 RepID=A0A3M2ME35_9ACTN|nr:ABC transporter ATP-binding protein [Actinomadura harenae]RMI47143.1 ABC transporter ATP-binding protein [Actinomadura harenae]
MNPRGIGTNVLEVQDLAVTYRPDVRAVRGVSFSVGRGQVLGVVGESGSGKTAVALAVLGLLPDRTEVTGSVRLRGRELLGLSDGEMSRIRGKDLAMVFQDPLSSLTPVHAVGDQIAEAIRIHSGATRGAARARAVELLDLVGIPDAARRARAHPHEFSGGMRQRVMIAMAVANDPLAIVADEPTTALDVTLQAQVLDVLRTAGEAAGAAILMITHDLGMVAGFADRVLVMYAGRAVESGQVEDIYRRPRMPYTIGLLRSLPRLDDAGGRPVPIDGAPPQLNALPPGCPFAPRCPIAVGACWDDEPEMLPVGRPGHAAACLNTPATRDPDAVFPLTPTELLPPIGEDDAARARTSREAVLDVKDLHRFHVEQRNSFGRGKGLLRAVDGVSFDIRAGETLGLVGESGCGKTTVLMEILAMARPRNGGRIEILGEDSAGLDGAGRKALRRNVQVVFQDPFSSLDPRMRVAAILAEPLRTHAFPSEHIPDRVQELLKLVGLEPSHANRHPYGLSGGQRQRVAIARALALEPSLVLLDEPVAALDVSVQAGVIDLLEELRARLGLAYLFVAHDLAVVRRVADRIAVMHRGRIVEIGDVEHVYEDPAHPYTCALLDAVPIPDPVLERKRGRVRLPDVPPDAPRLETGCLFRQRCPRYLALSEASRALCDREDPVSRSIDGEPDRMVACHYALGVST